MIRVVERFEVVSRGEMRRLCPAGPPVSEGARTQADTGRTQADTGGGIIGWRRGEMAMRMEAGDAGGTTGRSPRPNYDGVARLVDELGDAAQELLSLNARWDAASGGGPAGRTPPVARHPTPPPKTRRDVFEEAGRLGIAVPDRILASLEADGFGEGEEVGAGAGAGGEEEVGVRARSEADAEWMQRFIEGVGLGDEVGIEGNDVEAEVGAGRGGGGGGGALRPPEAVRGVSVSALSPRAKRGTPAPPKRSPRPRTAPSPSASASASASTATSATSASSAVGKAKAKARAKSPARASAGKGTGHGGQQAVVDLGRMEALEASVRRQLERAAAVERQLNERAWALDAREDALRGGEAEVEGRLAEVATSSRAAREAVHRAQQEAARALEAREAEVGRREKALERREKGFGEREKAAQGVVKAQGNVMGKVAAMKRELLDVSNRERAMRSEYRKEKRHLEETLELAQQACAAKDDEIRTLKAALNRQRRTARTAVAEESDKAVAAVQKQLEAAEDKAREKLKMTEKVLRAESSKALVALKAKLQEQWEGEVAAREKEVRNLTRARDAAETKRRQTVAALEEALSAAKFEVAAVKRGAAEEAKVAEAKALRLQTELAEARREAEERVADARRQAGWNVTKARQTFERELHANFSGGGDGSREYPPSRPRGGGGFDGAYDVSGESVHVARGLEESERARQAERANFLEALKHERERAMKAEELARQLAGVLESAPRGGGVGGDGSRSTAYGHAVPAGSAHRPPSPATLSPGESAYRTPASGVSGRYGYGDASDSGAIGSTLDVSREAAEQTRENLRMLLDRYGLDERGNAIGAKRQSAVL